LPNTPSIFGFHGLDQWGHLHETALQPRYISLVQPLK